MVSKKLVYLSLLSTFVLSACYTVKTAPVAEELKSCQDGSCLEVINNQPPAYSGVGSTYVNYTDVAADYKAYGERTVVDHRVGTSGASTNLSSSIPPVIEDEVVSYEEEVVGFDAVEEALVAENVSANSGVDVVDVLEEVNIVADADGFVEEVAEEDVVSLEDPVEDWLAEEGVTLKDLLSQWSDKSGWRLVWKSNRNYTLTAGAMFRARFPDAASALIRAFARATPAPVATFYKGNRVLVVETMEDENAY